MIDYLHYSYIDVVFLGCPILSRTDDADQINLPGFILHMNNRFTLKRVNSGGIILAYKTELSNFVNIVESESKYILWFKLNRSLFDLPRHLHNSSNRLPQLFFLLSMLFRNISTFNSSNI
jgi:hypothetical protein